MLGDDTLKNIIEIRSVSTEDVKIAQKGLETIGFKIVEEGDAIDTYWVKLSVPKKFSEGECVVRLKAGLSEEKDTVIKW